MFQTSFKKWSCIVKTIYQWIQGNSFKALLNCFPHVLISSEWMNLGCFESERKIRYNPPGRLDLIVALITLIFLLLYFLYINIYFSFSNKLSGKTWTHTADKLKIAASNSLEWISSRLVVRGSEGCDRKCTTFHHKLVVVVRNTPYAIFYHSRDQQYCWTTMIKYYKILIYVAIKWFIFTIVIFCWWQIIISCHWPLHEYEHN